MRTTITICLATMLLSVTTLAAKDIADLVNKGNEALKRKDLSAAMEHYKSAESQMPPSPELDYNVATVLYEQGKFEEATEKFGQSLATANPEVEAAAHYNLGNTHFRAGDYLKAIESYQSALGLSPEDIDAKYNLELARKMLKENSKPEEKENEEQKQEQEQEEQQQDQEQQDQEQQDQQDQQQQDQDNKQDKQEKKQQPQDKKMSREDAERILNALRDDEQKQQKKARRTLVSGNYVGKDW